MLKALLKKQFLELNAFYFQNKKTGKNRSKAGTIGFIILYIVLFVYLAFMFFMLAQSLAGALIPMGYGWLYYALMGLVALAFGVFGSVFNTYAGLYHAKDNELLLAMPIPPRRILLVRMLGVYAMGMLYTCILMVPTIVAGQLNAPGVWPLISQILLTILLGLVVLALTCFLGWIVALIAARLKNKSFITVILSLALIALYYVIYFRVNTVIRHITEHAEQLDSGMRRLYPIYAFGRAAEGDALSLLAFAAIALALCALCVWIMSRSFIRIVTMNRGDGAKKKDYHTQTVQKAAGAPAALLRREFKRFTASPTYMLNCGLGLVLLLAAAVAALIKADAVRGAVERIAQTMPGVTPALPVFLCGAVILMAALNPISAPSISLEGKTIWILQSLPVNASDVLTAKLRMHLYLCAGPTILCAAALAFVLRLDFSVAVYAALLSLLATMLFGSLGLALNLLRPNLSWTNETVPIKQSMPVVVVIFGGWFVAGAVVGLYFLLRSFCPTQYYLLGCIVVFALLCRLLNGWLKRSGAEKFASL